MNIDIYGLIERSLQRVVLAKTVHVMLGTLAGDFCEFAKEAYFLLAKVLRKWDVLNHYYCAHYSLSRATTSRRPGIQQGNSTVHLHFITFPFVCSGQASEGGASPQLSQPNTIVSKRILAPAAVLPHLSF